MGGKVSEGIAGVLGLLFYIQGEHQCFESHEMTTGSRKIKHS